MSLRRIHSLVVPVSAWTFGLLLAAVTIGSLWPGSHPPSPGWDDKVQHATAYGLLGLFGLTAFPAHPVKLMAGLILWSGLIEIGQSFVPMRSCEFADLVANTLGVCIAWGFLRLLGRFRPGAAALAATPE